MIPFVNFKDDGCFIIILIVLKFCIFRARYTCNMQLIILMFHHGSNSQVRAFLGEEAEDEGKLFDNI